MPPHSTDDVTTADTPAVDAADEDIPGEDILDEDILIGLDMSELLVVLHGADAPEDDIVELLLPPG